ncbi:MULTISPECIES: transposase [unclassified Paenibacillus]|uniref:transposase n=1 Tax=Paenibacillus sp. FSL H8-0259 TaxID=1920423 RepID=UPI001E645153|nr:MULTISPECIES: transposase [unclassified Paenibacillus]
MRRRHYRSSSCEGCPLKERCTKAAGNREVVVSVNDCDTRNRRVKFYGVKKVTPWPYDDQKRRAAILQ